MIINGLFFLLTLMMEKTFRVNLYNIFGLPYWTSPGFQPYQLFTHIFMHGDLAHLLSNMFALWLFGHVLENLWGGKRFLIYYLITAFGAALIHNAIRAYDIHNALQHLSPDKIQLVYDEGFDVIRQGLNYSDEAMRNLNNLINGPVVGASGAVFGVLLAFGMLFPNTELLLYFVIPVKAKYFVVGYGLIELYLGIQNNPNDNVAHFAHLGGMLFGFFLIKYWNKFDRKRFY